MCASLLANAATPCAMHSTSVEHAHDPAAAILVAVPAGHGTCHVDAGALGCAAGGACPTGGIAAPAWFNIPIGPRAASRTVAATELRADFLPRSTARSTSAGLSRTSQV